MAKHRQVCADAGSASTRWHRRPVIMLIAVGVAAAAVAGNAIGAPSPAGSTTNVKFVPLSPAFKLFTAKAFSANLKFSPVVIGGSTKVPTNATTVELQVEAGGKSAGFMNFYPAGNVGGGSGQFLSWGAGGTDTKTIQENVGMANELTFANGSTPATSTASIIGYSTQVTAGDISPADGSAGQVLTNTGTGASWQPSGTAYANDGGIVELSPAETFVTANQLSVPAGGYDVRFNAVAASPGGVADTFRCDIVTPAGDDAGAFYSALSAGTIDQIELSGEALITTTGGSIVLSCVGHSGSSDVFSSVLIAQATGTLNGAQTFAKHASRPTGGSIAR